MFPELALIFQKYGRKNNSAYMVETNEVDLSLDH
jgi:hypothetical protein